MYNSSPYPPNQGGYPPNQGGYPSNQGGYPPSQGGYPPSQGGYPQQPQQYGGAQTSGGIGFENLAGGAPAAPGSSYGAPPASTPYPGGFNQSSSFAGMAYAANAAMNFRPSQPAYPQTGYGGAPQQPPYGGAPSQPSYGGAPAQPPYGGAPSQPSYGGAPTQPSYVGAPTQPSYGGAPTQPPYGGAPTQPPYGGAPSQPAYGSAPSQPPYHSTSSSYGGAQTQTSYGNTTTQFSHSVPHGGAASMSPKRPPPPSSNHTASRGQIPSEPPTQGTIRDASNFDAQRDSEILRNAMKGIGTDEKAITSVIGCRSNRQRQLIKTEFATMYGKDLIKELKSELSGNYERAVLALLMTPADYDAYECYNAISGVGTDERCLIEILCSRSNTEISALKDAYRKVYRRDLERDLIDDTSGHFKRLLVSLVQGGRQENEPLDHNKAAQDARALYEAGEARWGTDESRFNVILGSRSFPQLRLILSEYEKISKRSLIKAIQSEMSGDLKNGMVSVVKCARNRTAFFAEGLYWSMKGLGTDDKTLIRIMASRCEVDMVQIKQEFQKAYAKTLESFIKDDCSGDYKRLLIQLCNGN